jgi:hypothetical protein
MEYAVHHIAQHFAIHPGYTVILPTLEPLSVNAIQPDYLGSKTDKSNETQAEYFEFALYFRNTWCVDFDHRGNV